MDFSRYELSGRYYAGSERKLGVRSPDGSHYMLKFQKETPFGKSFNHLSEYLGSHVFAFAGMPAQETYLGTYLGEPVVACKDFVSPDEQFVPFNDVGESTLEEDRDTYQYEYSDIMRMLGDNSKLTNVGETVAMFWRMYIIDALLGNFDRHGANWGFIKRQGAYSLAPVFDNGSCLFPRLIGDDSLCEVLASEDEILKRVYDFPTSQIKLAGKKSSYYAVIASLEFPECNRALRHVVEHLPLNEVRELIESAPGISDTRREFYLVMLEARYRLILKEPYENLDRQS